MTWKTEPVIWKEGKPWILTRAESHKWDGTDGSKLCDVSTLVWIYDYNTTGTHKHWEMTRMKLKVLFTVTRRVQRIGKVKDIGYIHNPSKNRQSFILLIILYFHRRGLSMKFMRRIPQIKQYPSNSFRSSSGGE